MAVHVLHLVDGLHHAAVVDVRDVRVDVQDVAVGETFLAVFDALLKGGVFKSTTTDVEPKLICHLRPTVKAGASTSTLVRATEDFCDPEVVPALKAKLPQSPTFGRPCPRRPSAKWCLSLGAGARRAAPPICRTLHLRSTAAIVPTLRATFQGRRTP